MRFLVLSDIHGNWEALDAVLGATRGQYDRVVCCGDLVGYGADPDRVTDWVREHVYAVVRGNHDRACCGLDNLDWFNPIARAAALWTQQTLSPENLAYLRELPKGPAEAGNFAVVHGSPVDEDEYVVSVEDARTLAEYLPAARCFFGHTHIQGAFEYVRQNVRAIRVSGGPAETWSLDNESWYLINPGSVGQPRDGDPRAAYALFDTDLDGLTLGRAEYDVEAAQHKIGAAGLPELLAIRLATGE